MQIYNDTLNNTWCWFVFRGDTTLFTIVCDTDSTKPARAINIYNPELLENTLSMLMCQKWACCFGKTIEKNDGH